MSIVSKMKGALSTALNSSMVSNNPQGLGLLSYAAGRMQKGESGLGAYATPLKLLGAAGALTVGAGAYKGATNREDKDNALIGGIKGMMGGVSGFGKDVLMPASLGVGALAATGFTRKFETGYMLTRRAGNARDNSAAFEQFSKAGRGNLSSREYSKKMDGLQDAKWQSIFPGGKAPKSGSSPGDSNSRNAVDRTTHLLSDMGEDVFNSPTAPAEMISKLIEKDTKAPGGALSKMVQGVSSMGYAAGGFVGEMDIAMGKAFTALKAGKHHGKTPDEIKQMEEIEKKAAEQAKNDPKAKSWEADLFSFGAKAAGAATLLGAGVYAGASAGNTGYFGGSPINIMSKGLSLKPNDADFIYSQEQQKMGQYEMVAAYNPSQVGMRDTDDAYSYSRSINPSSVNPMSPGLAQTSGRQRNIAPGQFGDTGSLVFAMNTLRRG
jgi:hypothetical protein